MTTDGNVTGSDGVAPIIEAVAEYRRVDSLDPWNDDSWNAASTGLAHTIPTTLAGCAEMLALYCDDAPWENGTIIHHEQMVANLLAGLRKLQEKGGR